MIRQTKRVLGITALVILGVIVFSASASFVYGLVNPEGAKRLINDKPAAQVVAPPNVDELLKLTNDERASRGLAPLLLDERLNASAQAKADDEVTNGYFGHENPVTGKKGYEYIREQQIEGCRGVENLRENGDINSSKAAIEGWMSSAAHRDAILNENATLVGFGISNNQVVQHFCTPL